MAKPSIIYTCSHCDAQYPKWAGRCSTCGKFGTIATTPEVTLNIKSSIKLNTVNSAPVATVSLGSATIKNVEKISTSFFEIDRVLGGGLARGGVYLLTGEPGVGKSTLLLALADKINLPVLYISGEEGVDQVQERSRRLHLRGDQIAFSQTNDIGGVVSTARASKPSLVIVDSLQTMMSSEATGGLGSPNQVKAVLAQVVQMAQTTGAAVVVIGHITKAGLAAGPKTVEHLVDVVLSLEGEESQSLRFLRASKNRFGTADEVGVLEMKPDGLQEVSNPSALFLQHRHAGAGSCITGVLEGSRSLLIEVQALVTRAQQNYAKRSSAGFDNNRLEMLIAVLAERAGMKLAWSDVYVNLAGGYKSREPALDLAVCLALASAFLKKPLPQDLVAFGEIGLGGEIRQVGAYERRINEAVRLGFKQVVTAKLPADFKLVKGLELIEVGLVSEVVEYIR